MKNVTQITRQVILIDLDALVPSLVDKFPALGHFPKLIFLSNNSVYTLKKYALTKNDWKVSHLDFERDYRNRGQSDKP
jgi:hypothetical protein